EGSGMACTPRAVATLARGFPCITRGIRQRPGPRRTPDPCIRGNRIMHVARIVVVEDEQPIRRGVADALRASGYEVVEATDGEQGLQAALRTDVDLVLLDLMLPRRDGLEVLRELREV